MIHLGGGQIGLNSLYADCFTETVNVLRSPAQAKQIYVGSEKRSKLLELM
jgi:hypothetical protein